MSADTEGYTAVIRNVFWCIADCFGVVEPRAGVFPDYKSARKHADKMNAAVIAGRFK